MYFMDPNLANYAVAVLKTIQKNRLDSKKESSESEKNKQEQDV